MVIYKLSKFIFWSICKLVGKMCKGLFMDNLSELFCILFDLCFLEEGKMV